MIPHNMTLFKFICVQYQFHRQTLPIMKIDRGQIQFRDYVSTGTEPDQQAWSGPKLPLPYWAIFTDLDLCYMSQSDHLPDFRIN